MKLVVKAGAGTGKTYRLSLEYIKALLNDISPENIVVTTFTRKAAQEIKERILSHLYKISRVHKVLMNDLKNLGVDNVDIERVKKIYTYLLSNKDKIMVTTIDSFINRIFNQSIVPYYNFYGYTLIDDANNEDYLSILLEKLIGSESSFNELTKFFSLFLEKDVSNYTRWISEFINNRWKFLCVDKRNRKYFKTYDIEKSFNIVLDNINRYLSAKSMNSDWQKYLKDEFSGLRSPETNIKDYLEKNFTDFFNYKGEKSFWNGTKIKSSKAYEKEHSNIINSYEKFKKMLASHIFNKKLIPLEKEIFKISKLIFSEYDKIKFKTKAFTHNDILIYTYQFINKNNSSNSEFIKKSMRSDRSYFLIDEFQDTSVLQWKILKHLVDSSKSFIAVGDEKQSIYSWRGGEKDLFVNLGEILGADINNLNTNYRSDINIVKFINKFFSNLGILDHNKKYMPNKEKGYLEINIKSKKVVKEEMVHRILKKKIFPNKTVILARTNNELEEIAVYLKENNIPFVKQSSSSILDNQLIDVVFTLLKFLVKNDLYDLIYFLRSDLIDISSNDMKNILISSQNILTYINSIKIIDKPIHLEEYVWKVLDTIKELKSISYKDLLSKIFFEFNIFNNDLDDDSLKNINNFFEMSLTFSNLSAFIDYLEKHRNSLKQVCTDEAYGIKLMTIHRSKGLEFETVILGWHFSSKPSNYRNKLSFSLGFDKTFEKVEDLCFTSNNMSNIFKYYGKNYRLIDKDKNDIEELNNLYVAMTRAKKNLIVFFSFDRNINRIDSLVNEEVSEDYEEDLLKIRASILKSLNIKSLAFLSYKPYISGSLTQSPLEHHDLIENSSLLSDSFNKTKHFVSFNNMNTDFNRELYKLRGTITHYFLSLIKSYSDIESAKQRTIFKFSNKFSISNIKCLIDFLSDFIKNNSFFRLSKDDQVFNEVQIFDKDESIRVDRIILNKNEKRLVIIDYKTGSFDTKQLEKYESILKRLYPDYRVESHILEINLNRISFD